MRREVHRKVIYPELSYEVLGVLFEVYNNLGYGYREVTYQKAIEEELGRNSIAFVPQAPYLVKYKNNKLVKRYLDFVIEDKMVLEIKSGDYFSRQNFKQVLEYLKVTNLKLAILANYTNKEVKYKRVLNIENYDS
ncbi:GxxExxY protein [Candidatus Parcubacteria bacterium]|nr:MAG: GxxExxY protein [Candidatus Parcubacteria bacterium]